MCSSLLCHAQLQRNPNVSLRVTGEEDLEREIGALQRWLQDHGAHDAKDIEREAGSSGVAAETKASFAIHGRAPDRREEPRVTGVIIAPALTAHETLAAVFTGMMSDAAALPNAVRACIRAREDGALLIVPADVISKGLSTLRAMPGVRSLCACVNSGASHERACLFA